MSISALPALLILIITAVLSACSSETIKEPMDEVTLQLGWKHQAQFAGFYAADLNGYYEKEGIKVTFRPKLTPVFNLIDTVVTGDAEFSMSTGIGLLKARSKKLPVTAIASIQRHYPLAFISLKEKNITRPIDFLGRTFRRLPPDGAAIVLDMFLKKTTIDKKDLIFIPVDYNLNLLFSGEIDVWSGYTINEVLVAAEKGIEINQIRPENFGVNAMGDTLFTSNMLINTNPDLVLRFTRATIHGWQWAVNHPESAGEMALQYDSTLNPAHQIAMMKASIPYIQGKVPIGMMEEHVWQEMYDALLEQSIIEKPLNLNTVYTNTFVQKIYLDNKVM